MSSFPINAENWQEGATLNAYMAGMKTYQADMERRMAEVRLSAVEISRLSQMRRPVKLTVLSEDWCIDCLMTLPIAAQIAAAAPAIDLRIFSRSKWQMLKDYYNGHGIMAIPVYSFLGNDFEEFATFVERPQLAADRLNEWKAAHPEIEEIRRSFSLSSQEKSARLTIIRQEMQVAMEGWYRDSCQSAMVAEFAALLGI